MNIDVSKEQAEVLIKILRQVTEEPKPIKKKRGRPKKKVVKTAKLKEEKPKSGIFSTKNDDGSSLSAGEPLELGPRKNRFLEMKIGATSVSKMHQEDTVVDKILTAGLAHSTVERSSSKIKILCTKCGISQLVSSKIIQREDNFVCNKCGKKYK